MKDLSFEEKAKKQFETENKRALKAVEEAKRTGFAKFCEPIDNTKPSTNKKAVHD